MIRIPVRAALNQEIITFINNKRVRIEFSYFVEIETWVISIYYNIDGELTPLILNKAVTVNSPMLGELADFYGLLGDFYIDAYYSIGEFNLQDFTENNYRLFIFLMKKKVN